MRRVVKPLLFAALLAGLAGCSGDEGPALDVKLIPLDDQAKQTTLADFAGKTILLDFWATWCGPCKQAMPEVQEVWDKYRSKGLEVVSISSEDRGPVLAFHHGTSYTYPVYVDPGGVTSTKYNVISIPRFVIIKHGRILWDSHNDGYTQGQIKSMVASAMD